MNMVSQWVTAPVNKEPNNPTCPCCHCCLWSQLARSFQVLREYISQNGSPAHPGVIFLSVSCTEGMQNREGCGSSIDRLDSLALGTGDMI